MLCCRVMSAATQLLQQAPVTMDTDITDRSPTDHDVDVVSSSRRRPTDDEVDYDVSMVTSRRSAGVSYLRHARMSICKMTADYVRRLPSSRTRKDRSATRRERKATKTLAIVLGKSPSASHDTIRYESLTWTEKLNVVGLM